MPPSLQTPSPPPPLPSADVYASPFSTPTNKTTMDTTAGSRVDVKKKQMHDFFVETLGHRSFAFLELEYCEGGDLHGLMLGESKRVGGGWRQRGAERGAESVVDARSSQGTAGLPVAHIGRLALGLCEGVQQLHEVRSQEFVIFTCGRRFFRGMLTTERRAQSS